MQEVQDKNAMNPGNIFIYVSPAVPAIPKIFFMTFGGHEFLLSSRVCGMFVQSFTLANFAAYIHEN